MNGLEVSDTLSGNAVGLTWFTSALQKSLHCQMISTFVGGIYIQFYQSQHRLSHTTHNIHQKLAEMFKKKRGFHLWCLCWLQFIRQKLMSFTERSQILVPIRLQVQSEVMMSGLSSCKRKGLSLSKQLKARQQERPQSFIKLSARTKQPTMIQKREIKLILRPRTDQEDKENNSRQMNRDHRKEEKERRNLDYLLPHRSSNTRTSKRTDVLRLVLR